MRARFCAVLWLLSEYMSCSQSIRRMLWLQDDGVMGVLLCSADTSYFPKLKLIHYFYFHLYILAELTSKYAFSQLLNRFEWLQL